ncbi:hypothetical protein ALC62_05269 [Cyphomyrmex costatus]|uniref:MADF domain-containing protein n=1 Tax=Cyphomyrmex costatus TaxID=456900 RepID=A0A151IJQ1_9HYME|nr:hypothetical protein ALC62_05269 [Cyphomyrmex costatus]
MSDEDDITNSVEDDNDEHDASLQQKLITLVKANPTLYAKNWKEYAGKDFCKDLAWENIGSYDDTSISSIENSKEKAVTHASTLSNDLNVEKCSSVVNEPKEMLKAIQKLSTKRTVPEPDNYAKRRKKEDHLFVQAMTKQSTALTSFAQKIGEFLTNPSQCSCNKSSESSVNDPVSTAIAYALKSVPEKNRLKCMVEILQLINSKYVQL